MLAFRSNWSHSTSRTSSGDRRQKTARKLAAAIEPCLQPLESRALLSASYAVSDITPPGSNGSWLNWATPNGGLVVGQSHDGNGFERAFVYDSATGQSTQINFGGTSSYAQWNYGNEDQERVVGYAYTANNAAYHAFLYDGGTVTDLHTETGLAGTYSNAYYVDDSGLVLGHHSGNNVSRAFVYDAATGQGKDLTLGGTYSGVDAYRGTNDVGQVVGNAYTANNAAYHAFLYSGGNITDLHGAINFGGTYSSASGINDDGQVVGWSYTAGNAGQHAFLYQNGRATDLHTTAGFGGTYSYAEWVTDGGLVVGRHGGNGFNHAFVYDSATGQSTQINFGGTSSYAQWNYGNEDQERVVGHAYTANNAAHHAFLYDGGTVTDLHTELGLVGTYSNAYHVKDSGLVLNRQFGNNMDRAFMYDAATGQGKDLTLGGTYSWVDWARGTNDVGQAVGYAYTANNAAQHAFLYGGGNITDLGTLGGTSSYALGINDSGQSLGGRTRQGT